ncbi:MAG: BrnA antitoxin family protein [Pseudomonadota bacterium]|nr:BrnA antitoxin family protein [Pseudomonadota bacterium]MDP1904918.1 BrnA antitoxin family protein [Pseudomonadota bacterium]MDP2352041.1 BrnA antitoxin family protein [Pseudomonadota bacterium]
MKTQSKTDWARVRREAAADTPISSDTETELYDPNDEAATAAFWSAAKVTRRGRPVAAVKRPTLNMRVDADVLEHLRGLGKGWQTKVNQLLREAVGQGKL